MDEGFWAQQVVQSSLTLSGTGVFAAGTRVLLSGQATGSQNGLWITASGAWSRAPEMPAGMLLSPGARIFIIVGSSEGTETWMPDITSPVTIGTNAVVFFPEPDALQTKRGLMTSADKKRVDYGPKIIQPQRSWGSVLPVNPTGMQLASGSTYWIYIGQIVSTVVFARFAASCIAVGSGTQTGEWAIATSPDEPARDQKTLTVRYRHTIVAANGRESFTTTGYKANATGFAFAPTLYSYVWLGMRVVMATTMPSFNCLYADDSRGLALITPASGALVVGTDYTGALYGANQLTQAPDLQIMLD